jgi:hypothetical protein
MIMHARKAQQEPAAITKSTRARPHCLSDHEMSAFGPKRTSLVAPHMSAFGGKADMTTGTCPLSWSLSGVKQTSLVAAHMSAFDPKRT